MARSLFPDGVLVRSTHLKGAAQEAALQTQLLIADSARAGVIGESLATGTTRVVDPTGASTFTIHACRARTSRGDLIEIPSDLTGVSLANGGDYSLSAVNYLCAVYRETQTNQAAHESDGTSRATQANRSYEIKVFTQTAFNALSATGSPLGSTTAGFEDDIKNANLALDALNRVVVLAKIIGKGFTGPTPNTYSAGDLGTNIYEQEMLGTIYSAQFNTLLEDPPVAPGLSGVNIKAVRSTNTGLPLLLTPDTGDYGTLQLVVTNTTKKLQWAVPTEALGVLSVDIQAVALGTVTTLQSTTTAYELDVEIFAEALPPLRTTAGTTNYTEDLTVIKFYDDVGGQFSIKDALHRSKMGSLVPTPRNPHGMGHQDFAQNIVNIPVPMVLGNDYFGSIFSQIARLIMPRDDTGADRTLMFEFTGASGAANVRFYKNESEDLSITYNAYWKQADALWAKDDLADQSWITSNGSSGSSLNFFASGTATWIHSAWKSQLSMGSPGTTNGLFNPGLGFLSSTGDAIIPRLNMRFANSGGGITKTLLFQSQGDTTTVGAVRVYRNSGSGTVSIVDPLEIVHNASWSNASSLWTRDITGDASKMMLGMPTASGSVAIAGVHRTSAGTWDDTLSGSGWESRSMEGLTNGDFKIGGDLIVDGGTTFGSGITAPSLTLTTDMPATPVAETLYQDLIPKFWGRVIFTTEDSITPGVLFTDFDFGPGGYYGPGIDTVDITTSYPTPNFASTGIPLTVTLKPQVAFSNDRCYIVIPHMELQTSINGGKAYHIHAHIVDGSTFQFWLYEESNNNTYFDITTSDDGNDTTRSITFVGYGKQSI